MINDLTEALSRYPAIARPCSPPEALGNAGGSSGARLWRYRSGQGDLVVRAWPIDGPGKALLERIHEWLAAASALDFIPAPIYALDGRTLQDCAGRYWEVCPWRPGTADLSGPPSKVRVRGAFAALGAFHLRMRNAFLTCGKSPGLARRLTEIEALLQGEMTRFEQVLTASPSDPAVEPSRHWLELAKRVAPRFVEPMRRASSREIVLHPCLRDARPDHFLFEGDHLSGLVDFGAMDVDSAAADLARLLSEWVGSELALRGEALNAYSAVRGLDGDELSLVEAFEKSAALLGAAHWMRWHFLENKVFDDLQAVRRGIERGVERLKRLENC